MSLDRLGLGGALPERLVGIATAEAEQAFIASILVSTRAARTASRRATSTPLDASSVDTALSATSELDGITVIISQRAARTSHQRCISRRQLLW